MFFIKNEQKKVKKRRNFFKKKFREKISELRKLNKELNKDIFG